MENEEDGRVGLMLYNGSDSLWILASIDNLVMQSPQGPSSGIFLLVFILEISLLNDDRPKSSAACVDQCVHELTCLYFFAY